MVFKHYKNVRSPKSWIHPSKTPDKIIKLIFWQNQSMETLKRESLKEKFLPNFELWNTGLCAQPIRIIAGEDEETDIYVNLLPRIHMCCMDLFLTTFAFFLCLKSSFFFTSILNIGTNNVGFPKDTLKVDICFSSYRSPWRLMLFRETSQGRF